VKRIEIQGAIVPPEFDLFGTLPAGLATSSASFTRSLREAEAAGEEIEVWINSPGGDVDAGNEMLAAFQSFKGYKCVTVGGLAASMAANFVLQCGARVEVHENTRLMFHSAYAETVGGAGSHRDVADALDRFNAPMIARLKELGVPSERVDEGFAEGRAFWLDAQEAVMYGIAAKIVKGAAPVKTTLSDTLALTDAVGRAAAWYRLARFPETTNATAKMDTNDPQACSNTPLATDPAPAADPAPADPAPAPADPAPADPAPADPAPADPAPAPADPAPADPAPAADPEPAPDPMKALSDELARAEETAAKTLLRAEEAERKLAEAEKVIALYSAEAAKLGTRTAALAESLEKEQAQHAALVGKIVAPSASAPATWPDAVRKLGAEEAVKRYPDLAAAYRQANAKK